MGSSRLLWILASHLLFLCSFCFFVECFFFPLLYQQPSSFKFFFCETLQPLFTQDRDSIYCLVLEVGEDTIPLGLFTQYLGNHCSLAVFERVSFAVFSQNTAKTHQLSDACVTFAAARQAGAQERTCQHRIHVHTYPIRKHARHRSRQNTDAQT